MATRNSSSCTVMLTGPALTAWGEGKPEGNCFPRCPQASHPPHAMRTGQVHCAEVLGADRAIFRRRLRRNLMGRPDRGNDLFRRLPEPFGEDFVRQKRIVA